MKATTKKAAVEKKMAQLEKELKTIENSAAFKKENAVKRALDGLMNKHGCSKNDLITLLQSDKSKPFKRGKKPAATTRKRRKLKVFKTQKPVKQLRPAGEIIKYSKNGNLNTD